MKKILILLVLAAWIQSSHGQTQDSPQTTRVKELFRVMHLDSLMSKTMDATWASMTAQMHQIIPDSLFGTDTALAGQVQGIFETDHQQLKEILGKIIDNDMVPLYVKYFTPQQIDDFIVFYKSPSGQAFLNRSPDLTKELMTIMYTKYMGPFRESMMKKVMDLVKAKYGGQ